MDTSANTGISIFPATEVTGVSVRTNNHREMSAGSSRIAELWRRFERQIAPRLSRESQVFGVYDQYESDHEGDFNVLAGTDQKNLELDTDRMSVTIQPGRYLVFPARGELPQSVISAWQRVWAYFERSDCPYRRAYTTDFELYTAKDSADIYIAVK